MELAPTVPSSRKRSWTSHIHQNHIKSPWRQQGYWESADAEWLLSCWWGVSQVARRRLHPSLSWFYLYLPHFSFFKYFKLFYSYAAAAAAKSLQSCPTLCDPIDGSPPGPLVPGILQARTLGWVAISSSRGIFPTQELNLALLHSRQILYRLGHQRSIYIEALILIILVQIYLD